MLRGLGYLIHTPAELYGSREAALGAGDDDWLGRVSPHGWACLTRDLKIYERPHELEAYRRAQVHVFLLPGEARSSTLTELISRCLPEICTVAVSRSPQSWKLTKSGLEVYVGAPKRARN